MDLIKHYQTSSTEAVDIIVTAVPLVDLLAKVGCFCVGVKDDDAGHQGWRAPGEKATRPEKAGRVLA